YVVAFEKVSVGRALSRSRQLIKGYAWPVFGRYLLLGAVALAFSIVTSIIFPTEQAAVTESITWEEVLQSSREADRNPLGDLLDTIWSVGLSIYGLAFGYHLYKNLSEIKGGAEAVAVES